MSQKPFDPNKVTGITLTPPIFPDHTFPKGALSTDMRSQACWYYYLLAQKQYEKVGESTDDQFAILDINPWQNTHYEQLARSIAMLYQLESPSEFAKAWPEVETEARNCRLPEPKTRYKRVAPHIIRN